MAVWLLKGLALLGDMYNGAEAIIAGTGSAIDTGLRTVGAVVVKALNLG